MTVFTYKEFTTRNLGFVSAVEQAKLKGGCVFICGAGSMGGSTVMNLIRTGVGKLILADLDEFEVSNLNRQLFATLHTVDHHKGHATSDQCLQINPEAEIEVLKADWPDHVERRVSACDVVINGTDDLGASLLIYRTTRKLERCVIDAYAPPLPSVYVTAPGDPMPEEWLGYPTIGTAWDAITQDMRDGAMMAETTHIMLHSSSRYYIDMKLARKMVASKRSRMSFAPMVIMAGEAINILLDRPAGTDHRGWFFNAHAGRVERPKPSWLAACLRPLVRREINKLLGA